MQGSASVFLYISMACTIVLFDEVKVKYLKQKEENKDGQICKVEVRRVSEEAQLTILQQNCIVFCKCTISSESEHCRAGECIYLINVHGDNSVLLTFSAIDELKRFQSTINFRPNVKSVFDKRTEESSAAQYFQFYGYLSQQQNMMQDYIRTGTYQKAMLQNYINFRDKVVLDVGAGSGILSFFAMQAGARKVYAVEASTMAEHTKKLVSCSQYAGRIVVIPGKIEEITLPEKVDVIISEPMGYMLFNERMLETFLHAKKFLNQPNGLMFPTMGDLHVAPFSDELLYMEQFTKANFWYQQSFHGVDLSPLRDDAVEEYFKQPIVDTFDVRILMAKSVKHTVNFLSAHEEDLHRIEIPLRYTAHTSGTVHGLAFWFDIAFIGTINTVWLSTSPTESLTHWYQVRCLFRSPLFIKAGEVLLGKVVLRSNKRQSYDVDIEAMVESTGCKAENSLDLKNPFFHYTGQPPAPPAGAQNTSPSDPYCAGVGTHEANQQNAGFMSNTNSMYPSSVAPYNESTQAHAQNTPSNHYQNREGGRANMQNGLNAHCNTVPLLSGGIPYPGTVSNSKSSLPHNDCHVQQDHPTPAQNGPNLYY